MSKIVIELDEDQYLLVRRALNDCAGGLRCRHTVSERRAVADVVRGQFSDLPDDTIEFLRSRS